MAAGIPEQGSDIPDLACVIPDLSCVLTQSQDCSVTELQDAITDTPLYSPPTQFKDENEIPDMDSVSPLRVLESRGSPRASLCVSNISLYQSSTLKTKDLHVT
jgi:hypothetical protein